MTDIEVLESLDNAWRALNKVYNNNPDENIRWVTNFLAKIIGEVKTEVKRSHEKEKRKEGQITIEEWIAFLNESLDEEVET